MCPGRTPDAPSSLARRGLVKGLAFGVTLMAGSARVSASIPALDPALRDAALRGLALAGFRGDAVSAQAAEAAIARLADTDPEGALLARLYRALDVRPAMVYRADLPLAAPEVLALLHAAIAVSQPVAFGYTDLSDQTSARSVLPLALVHPPQGVKLLAWCEAAEGYRQFFVRAMQDVQPLAGDFSAQRMALLHGLLEKERA